MPVYRFTRTEVAYIEAANEEEADEVYGLAWDRQDAGDGAQGGRLGGEVKVEVVTDHAPDFTATHEDGALDYETSPDAGA